MSSPKIVVIGAGSASFGLSVLGPLLREPALRGARLALVDINAGGLAKIERLARRLNEAWDAGWSIEASTERREALPGADFVILAIAVDRESCWKSDQEIALRHGIMHYAENGGPAALFHAARNITLLLPMLRDMEALCPDAWLLNFTNPMARICTAVLRHSRIRPVGICHQLGFGYMMLGVLLGRDLGIAVPDGYRFVWRDREALRVEKEIARAAQERIAVTAAGTNHCTWMLDIRERGTGRDLYPLLWERNRSHDPGFEPFNRDMAGVFGCFPVPGDCHLVEYLPYTHNPARGGWERYDIQMYPLDGFVTDRDGMWERIDAMGSGAADLAPMRSVPSERAEHLIAAMCAGTPRLEEALNLPNAGHIPNLPADAIVEVPAMVTGAGPLGVGVGPLPEPVAELLRRQISVVNLAVDAAVTGDRQMALQALALDPMVDSLDTARGLLADYLEANRDYLPQFG
jgi:alpha-galactosidase